MTGRLFDANTFEPRADERERLLAAGFWRVPMDIPWPLEPVNITVVTREAPAGDDGPSLALIDAGLRYKDNLTRLETRLRELGYALSDVDEIWLTHPHIDHFGLTGDLVALTGATVHCFAATMPRFHDYLSHWASDRAWVKDAFVRSGVSEELLASSISGSSQFHKMGGPLRIDETFGDGDVVHIAGREATVLHVPGHSPWCTAFWFADTQTLVSGDALLENISSNPILYPPDVGERSWQGIPAYRRSLQKMAALPAQLVLPGHGRSFSGHKAITEHMLEGQDKRRNKILGVMQEGAQTPLAIAEQIFGETRAHKSLFLVLSEILRHLDWLLEEALIYPLQRDDIWRYACSQATSSAA